MAIPFANAVIKVFNRMYLPEYVAHLCFAAKLGPRGKGLFKSMETLLVWCGVHGDKAMIWFVSDTLKGKSTRCEKELALCLRNMRMSLSTVKKYTDLCKIIGFLDVFTLSETLQAVPKHSESKSKVVATSPELYKRGENLLWEHIGGVPGPGPMIQETFQISKEGRVGGKDITPALCMTY